MSRNVNSEVGAAEDNIRAIVQMGCAEIHAMTLYYKTTAEMENGLVDVTDPDILQKQLEKADLFREDIEVYADLRRRMTKALFDMFDGEEKDKTMWCQIKHLGLSAMQIFETYEASDNDPELLSLAYEANKAFTKAVTRFLGIEITSCSACLSDALKAVERDDIDDEI